MNNSQEENDKKDLGTHSSSESEEDEIVKEEKKSPK